MTELLAGSRIPVQRIYDRIIDRTLARMEHRECPHCARSYQTVEVPLWIEDWPEFCPECHCRAKRVLHVHPDQWFKREWARETVSSICKYGGIWKRYQCGVCQHCGHAETSHAKGGGACTVNKRGGWPPKYDKGLVCACPEFKPHLWASKQTGELVRIRWSVGIFLSDGMLPRHGDVTKCQSCVSTEAFPVVPTCKPKNKFRARQETERRRQKTAKRKELGIIWTPEWIPALSQSPAAGDGEPSP